MKHARALSVAATAALAVGLLTVPAVTANADGLGACNVSISIPSKVKIVSDDMSIPATLQGSGCINWVTYDIVRSDGAWTWALDYDAPGVQYFSFTSQDGPGQYRATNGDGADEWGDGIYAPDSNWMTAKFASHAQWKGAKRAGKTVTLTAGFTRYSFTGGEWGTPGWGKWKGAVVHFQEKVGSAWRTVKTVHTNKKGVAQVRIKAGKHTWRAIADDASTTWGIGTGTHRK